ncbi:DNA endonuclease [Virgibacillus soli]
MKTLTKVQFNVLIASIIGDGEITKIYPYSRSINNSYREHYGKQQEPYRIWKKSFLPNLLYLTPKSNTLRSRSCEIFTKLYPYFYDDEGKKKLPFDLIKKCQLPHFLAILYMDDGTLSLTNRVNHIKKKIYITPQIYLYLQNYPQEQLVTLKSYIGNTFNINLKIGKRKDRFGSILRTTSVRETFAYLDLIKDITSSCPSMYYKTNWQHRLSIETARYNEAYPNYTVITSDHNRFKNYDEMEIEKMIALKIDGCTDQYIADQIGRSYWSVVYKFRELRKEGLII